MTMNRDGNIVFFFWDPRLSNQEQERRRRQDKFATLIAASETTMSSL